MRLRSAIDAPTVLRSRDWRWSLRSRRVRRQEKPPVRAVRRRRRPSTTPATRRPAPPEPVAEPTIVPPEPVATTRIASASLDDLNRNSPLQAGVLRVSTAARSTPTRSGAERGCRRAEAISHLDRDDRRTLRRARDGRVQSGIGRTPRGRGAAYLVSLGISADRLRTVSYGKEFPFDPGHDEAAYSKNRRAHFVITAK